MNNLILNDEYLNLNLRASDFWGWEMDSELNFVYLSKNVEDILDYKPIEMLTMNLIDFISENCKTTVVNKLKLDLKNLKSFWDLDVNLLSKKGKIIEAKLCGILMVDDNNVFCGYKGICYNRKILK
jgi:hypothetical protein